jgi:hypothetical protein
VVLEFTTRGVTQDGSSTEKEEGRWREEGDAPKGPTEEGNGQEGDAQEGSPPPQEEDGLAGIRFRRIDLLQGRSRDPGRHLPAGVSFVVGPATLGALQIDRYGIEAP